MRQITGLLICACLMVLSACQSAPPPKPLQPGDVPARFSQSGTADAPALTNPQWWDGFKAPELTRLVNLALARNTDLQAAVERVRQADARARQAGAALVPAVGLSAAANHLYGQSGGKASRETDFSLGLGASYELDFWGKNADLLSSARALARANRADRETVALTVSAGVANTYFQLLALRERLQIAQANIETSRQSLAVITRRVKAGYAAPADQILEEANLAALLTALPGLEQQELEARDALALLTGQPPEAFEVSATALDGLAAPVVAPGLPADLLLRRPDIVSAEANLAAAHADLAAARTAFLPDISLTAGAGIQNPALGAVVNTLNGTGFGYEIGAALVQLVFDGGRTEAKTQEAEARERELLATYRGAVLASLQDVENALGNVTHMSAQQMAAGNQLAQSQRLLTAAQNKYRAGSADYLVVVDAERTLYAARDQLAQIQLARLSASVALFRALGGGWSPAAPTPSNP
jgi:outer membrane protein, multidrug efflux system